MKKLGELSRTLPFKPVPRNLKPAFNSPFRSKNNKGPVLHKHFKYDLKEMFSEKGASGVCYKSLAKREHSFDKDAVINELITRGNYPDTSIEK